MNDTANKRGRVSHDSTRGRDDVEFGGPEEGGGIAKYGEMERERPTPSPYRKGKIHL